MRLHEKIRNYINENNMTIKEVGEKTSIEIKRFYRILAGDSKMTADEFEEICKVLDVKPDIFFNENILETKSDEKQAI